MAPNQKRDPELGLHYREVLGGLMSTRAEIRSRRPQPEIVVKLDLAENEGAIIASLLGNKNLEFKVVAICEGDDAHIDLHIRLKKPQVEEAVGIQP